MFPKRTLLATAIGLAGLALPSAASAETMSCQVSAGGFFDPPMGDPFQRSGSTSGSYNANTGGLVNRSECVHHQLLTLWHSRFTTRGTFTTTQCGTGTLRGDPASLATVIDVGPPFNRIVGQMAYTIELQGWQGILRVTQVNGRVEQGGNDIDGFVTVVPQHACLAADVETFTLDGGISLTW